ncbi:uncharacterized protein LOC121368750 [Gigantopelta aegis]|uniref:uncharacterized protein LOC121368750 n=1 Tax=Gigantopelta aegis TaxID=1735272 RepID=UPI001B88AE17|nr:uncharacterized protein LOC121368750 [Gigantopelta aegis]
MRFAKISLHKRIKVRRNNELVPTNTLILSFNVPTLPTSVKAGYLYIPVVRYIPNPLRCFKCQKFGYGQNTCRNRLTCARCGQFDHDSKTCQNDMICTNCKGKHCVLARVPKVESVVLGKSYATALKVSTTSIATQTDLTWPNSEDTFKKISHPKDVKKQTVHKQVSTSTQVCLDSRNPSRGSSPGEPGPSKPPSRKDTKMQHKDSSSGRLKKAEKK